MSLTDKYTDIANALRKQYGTTDKYYLADMPTLINGLEVHNLIQSGQFYDSTRDMNTDHFKPLSVTIDDWNEAKGKNVTLSFDIKWSNYTYESGLNNRIGMEWGLFASDGTAAWINAWFTPSEREGNTHIANTIYLQDKEITSIAEGGFLTS